MAYWLAGVGGVFLGLSAGHAQGISVRKRRYVALAQLCFALIMGGVVGVGAGALAASLVGFIGADVGVLYAAFIQCLLD